MSLYVKGDPASSVAMIPNGSFVIWSITELFDTDNSSSTVVVNEFSRFQNNQLPFQAYGSQTISDGSIIFEGTSQNVTRILNASSIP
jgi:hypothetical protein